MPFMTALQCAKLAIVTGLFTFTAYVTDGPVFLAQIFFMNRKLSLLRLEINLMALSLSKKKAISGVEVNIKTLIN